MGSGEVLRVCVLCAVKYCACECTVRGEVLCYSVLNTVNDVQCTGIMYIVHCMRYSVRRTMYVLHNSMTTVYLLY